MLDRKDIILERLMQLEKYIKSIDCRIQSADQLSELIKQQNETLFELIHILKAINENKFR